MADRGRRLLMLGLDGADLHFIQRNADALPQLKKALSFGQLYQPAAPTALSGSVWPTFYSGSNPGQHGIYQHLVWDSERMGLRRIGDDWCPYDPFWKNLEDQGKRVVVLDVPYSFGTSLQRGVEITDWATHGQTLPFRYNRPDIEARIRRFGRSPIGRETPVRKSRGQLNSICRELKASAARKADLVRQLMGEMEWDFFLAIFAETHRGGHLFFDESDISSTTPDNDGSLMLQVYQAVDTALADILKDCDQGTAILIFSVHGMMLNPAQEHVVKPMMDRLNAAFLREHCGHASAKPQSSGGMVGALRRMVPSRLQHAVGSAAPDSVRQWVVEQEIIGGLDWSATPGFALRTDIRTELRLNLIGREAEGILERGSQRHHDYVAFIRSAFMQLTDADSGVRLVEDMVDIHAQCPGPMVDRLPDYAITWNEAPAARRVHTPLLGTLEVNRPGVRGGDHTDFGFALLMNRQAYAVPDLPPLDKLVDFAGYVEALLVKPVPT
ncbi:MAG: alkaline phosphatase family protein [Alphaproteobacteria bacterium]|nr:alkaline phosphatase family protein [Alphaproteobacteria bacterium]